jgi:hypothetical protein
MALDGDGNAYPAGRIRKEYVPDLGDTYELLALKLSAAGALDWQQQRTWGYDSTSGTDICLDSTGNVLLLAMPQLLGSPDATDFTALLACNPSGDVQWGLLLGSQGRENYRAQCLVADEFGAMYVAGEYFGDVSIDSFSFIMKVSPDLPRSSPPI